MCLFIKRFLELLFVLLLITNYAFANTWKKHLCRNSAVWLANMLLKPFSHQRMQRKGVTEVVQYKKVLELKDFEQIVDIQRDAWGFRDTDLLPTHIMTAYKKMGEIWGAFDGQDLVGFSIALPTSNPSVFYLHMIATKRTYRGHGIAKTLLENTFSHLRERNVTAVYWTYDVVDLANTNFYHNSLGAVGVGVAQNLYGRMDSKKQGSLPSHRMYCMKTTGTPILVNSQDTKLIQVPFSLDELKKKDVHSATESIDILYQEIERQIENGYFLTGFDIGARTLTFSKYKPEQIPSVVKEVTKLIHGE